jgi:hypothetical protein
MDLDLLLSEEMTALSLAAYAKSALMKAGAPSERGKGKSRSRPIVFERPFA